MYQVSIKNSINRILKTPLGSRVMRPKFGSKLYELRDRKFDERYKLLAKKYIYESVNKYDPRIKVENVDFKIKPINGVVIFIITLTNGEVIELEHDQKT